MRSLSRVKITLLEHGLCNPLVSICSIHNPRHSKYLNLDADKKIPYAGKLGLLLPVGALCIQVVTNFPP